MKYFILAFLSVLTFFSSVGQLSDSSKNYSNNHINKLTSILSTINFHNQNKNCEFTVAYIDSIIGHMFDYQMPYYDHEFIQKQDSIIIESIIIMDNIIKQQPISYNYAVRAALYGLQDNYEEGINDLNRAIFYDSSNYMYFYNRAILHKKTNNLSLALKDYNTCIQLSEKYGAAYHNRGFLNMELKNYDNALSDFLISLSLCNNLKDSSFTYNNIGHLYYLSKKYSLALENINKSIDLNNINSYAYKNKALVEIELDELDLACENLYKAIQLGYRIKYGEEVDELIKRNCNKE